MSYGGRRGREQRKASYSFPILSRDTILQCLQELQIPCTLDDLEKPKPPFVRMVFENLAEHCMGVTKEEMNQPKFQGLDALQFPELHETSVPQITFFRIVAKLMSASQISGEIFRGRAGGWLGFGRVDLL